MTVRRALSTAVLALAAWLPAAWAPAALARSAPPSAAAGRAFTPPTGAAGRVRWRGCFGGLQCGRLRVPLDRTGGVPGSVSLRVARGEFAGPRAGHLMYLSGGPGGAGIVEMIDVLLTVPSLLDRFDVIGFDQRGTGASGLLRCPAIERDPRLRSTRAGAACAERLGARRAFYTTPDSVEDMEAVRRALGVRKLTLFGISYGTALALAYARAYPERVERLILDSVADPDDSDPYGLAGFRAMPGTLASLCRPRCVSGDPAADLAALVKRLGSAPLRGEVVTAGGERLREAVRPVAIADLLYDADYAPALRAGVPAAVRAALAGDAAPLLRLLRISAGFAFPSRPADFSAARYATVCEETPLPWAPGTAFADRLGLAREGAAALGPAAFFPFDADVAFADEIELCLRWPDPGRPSVPGGAYPDVPALLLQGEEDLRTPPEASARMATLLPRSLRVTVPGVGHAVVGADPSGCGIRQLRRWLAGDRVRTRCPRVGTGVPAVTVPPASFRAVEPAGGVTGSGGDLGVRRTVAAIDATLADLAFSVSPGAFGGQRGGGLRGGWARLDGAGRTVVSRLMVVPGVRVTGRERRGGTLRLRVEGSAAARGRIAVSRRGRLTGRLGGRTVRARLEHRPPRAFGLFSAGGDDDSTARGADDSAAGGADDSAAGAAPGVPEAVASVAVSTPVVARP